MEAIHIKELEIMRRLDKTIDALLVQLDDAIDDVEKGRVLSEEELWAEIDEI